MESSEYCGRISGHRRVDHAEEGLRIIDEFFETEARLSEEDKFHAGIEWAKEHGWMSEAQGEYLEKDFHDSLAEPLQSPTDWPEPPDAA